MANKFQNEQQVQQPTAQQVMKLNTLNSVIKIRVSNFSALEVAVQERIHFLLRDNMVCKIPDRLSEDMLFFLSTRTHRMAELFNRIANGPLNDVCNFDIYLVCAPNRHNLLPNIWYSLYNKKGGRK